MPEAFCISLLWNLRDHQGGDAHHWLHHTGRRAMLAAVAGCQLGNVLGMLLRSKFRYVCVYLSPSLSLSLSLSFCIQMCIHIDNIDTFNMHMDLEDLKKERIQY